MRQILEVANDVATTERQRKDCRRECFGLLLRGDERDMQRGNGKNILQGRRECQPPEGSLEDRMLWELGVTKRRSSGIYVISFVVPLILLHMSEARILLRKSHTHLVFTRESSGKKQMK